MNTANQDSHLPSTFALDVYWASGKPGDTLLERHLAECARCRAYLAALDAALPAPTSAAHDEAPAERAAAVPPLLRRLRRGLRLAAPALGALALAAGWMVLGRARTAPRGEYVAAKGTPAVQVLVHRGNVTQLWDGRAPMQPGDALALRVACEGLTRVVVAAPDGRRWQRLSDDVCPADGTPLPFTLVVDSQPGDERLAVVLSDGPLDDAVLQDAVADTRRAEDVWVVPFLFPKSKEPR